MSKLGPEIAYDLMAACQAGAGEAGEALGRALGATITMNVGEAANYDADSEPAGVNVRG